MSKGNGGTRNNSSSNYKRAEWTDGREAFGLVTRDLPEKYLKDPTMDDFAHTADVSMKKDGSLKLSWLGKEKYGDVSIETAFQQFKEERMVAVRRYRKLQEFEKFLHNNAQRITQSSQSLSTYYQYNGVEYRFSNHIYPTGSMTNSDGSKIDLAADIHLIDKITW